MEIKKIAIYCRISTADQTNLNQEIRLKEYADKNGWNYDIFNEVESSRKTRPIKADLLNRLRKHEYDGLLIFRYDRWARSLPELVNEVYELSSRNIAFMSYQENVDFSTPNGKFMFSVYAGLAEFERELIRLRTIEGLKRALSEGKIGGRPRKDGMPRTSRKYPTLQIEAKKKNDEVEKKLVE